MIQFENVSYAYPKGKEVLSNLRLDIGAGTICGLLGRNGVGKSTMLYLICGLLRPSGGRVRTLGCDPAERDVRLLRDVFIVPEEFTLPSVGLKDYLRVNSVFYPKYDGRVMERLLQTFEMPGDVNLGRLSMGQKKKIFLSFAMACNTSVLLLDEPTNGLDITAKRAFRMALSSIMDDEKVVLVSTHQVHDVEQVLDHVVIADNNRILLNASMAEIGERLRFGVTNDPKRIGEALFSIPIPGGFAVVERVMDPTEETEVNLECLFEMAQNRPDLLRGCHKGASAAPQEPLGNRLHT